MDNLLNRAQGCLLGQLAGDSLGSLVEFESTDMIRKRYPDGVRDLADGGTWGTLAGQPTDDSEMALMLARSIVEFHRYDPSLAYDAYQVWLESNPFDCGNTTYAGLTGHPNLASQANGALMRISPLGIFGANYPLPDVATWAKQDAALTHPNEVCQEVNALYVMAVASAVREPHTPKHLYQKILLWTEEQKVGESVLRAVQMAAKAPPENYSHQQGWVLIAFQNALWQLLHAPNAEEGIVDSVMRGGDTDTNAAICGALLGAVYGRDAIPERWIKAVLNCRPTAGNPHVRRPRPESFWPVDALVLAEKLLD